MSALNSSVVARARGQAIAAMMRGDMTRVQVDGDCMSPTLEDGWLVQLVPSAARVGDVVALTRQDGTLAVHRYLGQRLYWESQDRGWIRLAVTRPDQGAGFDPEVPLGDILGVVNRVRRSVEGDFEPFSSSVSDRCAARLWFGRYLLRRLVRGSRRVAGLGQRPRSGNGA